MQSRVAGASLPRGSFPSGSFPSGSFPSVPFPIPLFVGTPTIQRNYSLGWRDAALRAMMVPVLPESVLTGIVAANAALSWTHSTTGGVTGTIGVDAVLGGTVASTIGLPSPAVTAVADLSEFFHYDDRITGADAVVTVHAALSASPVIVAQPSSDPEGRYATLGYRPGMPLIVYAIGVLSTQDIATGTFTIPIPAGAASPPDDGIQIPTGGSFLVDEAFIDAVSTGLPSARSGYIGTKSITSTGAVSFTFRPPDVGEVVWYVSLTFSGATGFQAVDIVEGDGTVKTYPIPIDHGLYRWDGHAWRPYRSVPERTLDAQRVFEHLDPDGIYSYFARVVGAGYPMVSADSFGTLDLFDSRTSPERFLVEIARQYGMSFREDDTTEVKRRRLSSIVATARAHGLPSLVESRLADLGFSGFVNEVWVNTAAPDNWTDLTSAPAAIRADARARGIDDRIMAESGQKGQDILDKPVQWPMPPALFADHPADGGPLYVLSSRVSVHVNHLDGSPIPDTPGLDAIKEDVARELMLDVLPMHVDIRYFVTGYPSDDTGETAILTDGFGFTVNQQGVGGPIVAAAMLSATFRVDGGIGPSGAGTITVSGDLSGVVLQGDAGVGGTITVEGDVQGFVGPPHDTFTQSPPPGGLFEP